ncbi:GNAT family N-acetyltransferase [Oceanobacillus saliphilus]|uniref:GNAT family N-acetyltransferase n=1 Tax=Oceanobacillus saliphilus TaxID=2925834 RepID=UPI00201E4929|nr:GNAT family N-acetyltransferase [Oceanobacillus saliphilus]
MGIEIVACQPEHSKVIAEICAIGWQQTVEGKLSEKYQEIAKQVWYTEERVKNEINKGIYKYSAIADGKVVGTIGGELNKERLSWIWVLYIDEAYRYQGIGKKLLQAYSKDHQEAGATEQWVTVMDENFRGIPFYESNGFVAQERVVKKTETDEDEIVWKYKRSLR